MMATTTGVLFFIGLGNVGIAAIVFSVFMFKNPSKVIKAGGVVSIFIGILMTGFVAGSFISMRMVYSGDDYGYVDTGIMVTWDKLYESFSYNDVKYKELDFTEGNIFWTYCYLVEENKAWKPSINIRDKVSLYSVVSGDDGKETLYTAKTGNGIELYSDELFIFCAEKEGQKIIEYYAEDIGEKWTFCLYDGDRNLKYNVDVSEADVKALNAVKSNKKISYEYYENEIEGEIISVSSDGLIERSAYLIFVDGKWYWSSGDLDKKKSTVDKEFYYAYELPESFEKKLPHEFE